MSTLPLALTLALLLQLFSVAKCTTVKATVYADNYFEFYVDGVLTQKDPLDFTPHQAVAFSFDKPAASTTYAIKAQDYATSSGYEYVNNTQMIQIGDGALRMTFSDGTVSGTPRPTFMTQIPIIIYYYNILIFLCRCILQGACGSV